MSKFRLSTCIDADQEDHQVFDHRIDAENAAATLARGGFFFILVGIERRGASLALSLRVRAGSEGGAIMIDPMDYRIANIAAGIESLCIDISIAFDGLDPKEVAEAVRQSLSENLEAVFVANLKQLLCEEAS